MILGKDTFSPPSRASLVAVNDSGNSSSFTLTEPEPVRVDVVPDFFKSYDALYFTKYNHVKKQINLKPDRYNY
jgi:hypothetical protein